MRNFYFVEMYKLFKRKDVRWTFAVVVMFPIISALLLKAGSPIFKISGGTMSSVQYGILIFLFLKFVLYFHFVFIIFTSSVFALEIERGTINLLIIKSKHRSIVILLKLSALATLLSIFIVGTILSGIAGYYMFLYNTKFANNNFLGHISISMFCSPLLSFLGIVFVIVMTALFSVFLNNYKTIILSMGVFIFMKILGNFRNIKKFIPTYLSSIDNVTGKVTVVQVVHNVTLLLFYIAILTSFALYFFIHIDIKN